MKAIALTHYLPIKDSNSLFDTQVEKPTPQGREILVNVHAVSVNPVDTKIRMPKDIVETSPRILGWDASGTVAEIGDKVENFNVGDAVYYAGDISKSGSNCEYQLIDERIVGHAPKSLTVEEAASMPLTSITAWEALFERLAINRLDKAINQQQNILIIGGAGGVGSIAVQLAKWAGLTVIATASKPESKAWCQQLGADVIINHHEDMKAQLSALSIEQTDYILCLNQTTQHFDAMVEIIRPQGKICTIVETDAPLDMNKLKQKSATFAWEFMFTRALFTTDDMQEQQHLLNELAQLIDSGVIKHTLTKNYSPLNASNLRQAHKDIEQGTAIGKIVVSQW